MANAPSKHTRFGNGNGRVPGLDVALPSPTPAPEAAPVEQPPLVDLNAADVDALRQLRGIGRAVGAGRPRRRR